MGGKTRILGASLLAIVALSSTGTAWAQGTQRAARATQGAERTSARPKTAPRRRPPTVRDAPRSAQPGEAWARVVGATFARFEQLQQEIAPAALDMASRQPAPDLLAFPQFVTRAPEAGPTEFSVGPFQFTLAPVVAESPVVANVRAPQAQLLGITVRKLP